MFDIITFGSAFKDITISSKNLKMVKYPKDVTPGQGFCLPAGSKIEVEKIYFNTGGGGANTAAAFSLQGMKTGFCGMVGNDFAGHEIIDSLAKLGVDTNLVTKNNTLPTSYSVVILGDSGERTILLYSGASGLMKEKDMPFEKLRSKWFYIAPLTGSFAAIFERIIDFAAKNKVKIAANPSLAQLSMPNFTKIARRIDILILNQEEASFLTKIPYEKETEIFKTLDEMCPGVAVMTKGPEGVVVSDGKTMYRAKPNGGRIVVDTTGAGDSFASGFVTGYISYQGDIEKAIQLGMANAEGCISEIGAENGLLEKGQTYKKVLVEVLALVS